MIALIVRRLLLALVTLFIISLIVFLGVEALPGDSATGYLGQFATPESLAALRDEFGLNVCDTLTGWGIFYGETLGHQWLRENRLLS